MMSTTNVTLRINSYQTKNRILSKEVNFSGTSKAKNCESASILDCLKEFFEAVTSEVNDNFSLTVCGNVFEQALVRAEAERWKDVISCTAEPYSVSWSSRSRLQFLKEALGAIAQDMTANVAIAGNQSISIPEYPLVSLCGTTARKLVVSSDLCEIKEFFDGENCEPVAFWVGGHSYRMENGNQHIIGCTVENVQALVCGYLETRYINPYIGKLFQCYVSQFAPHSSPQFFLLDKVEPYFYADSFNKRIELFPDEKYTLGLHSISMDAKQKLCLDNVEDFHRLKIVTYKHEPTKQTETVLSIDGCDPRIIYTHASGLYTFGFLQDNDDRAIRVDVIVKDHVYIHTLNSEIVEFEQPVVRWRIGKTYAIKTTFQPSNAEDRKSIIVTTDRPDIAIVENNNKITILQEGEFKLITVSSEARNESFYYINNAIVKAVHVQKWPKSNTIGAGSLFESHVYAEPATANWKGCSCEVIKGGNKVSATMDTAGANVCIQAIKPGTCTIRFFSNDRPEISRTKKLTVLPGPPKDPICSIFGVIIAVFGLFLLFYSLPLSIAFSVVAIGLLVVGCIRRELHAKIMFASIILTYLLICCAHFLIEHYSTKYPEEAKYRVSENVLSDIKEQADIIVSNSVYVEDPVWSKKKWTVIKAEYQGYLLSERLNDYYLFIVHKTTIVNPDAEASESRFSVLCFEGHCYRHTGFTKYSLYSSKPDFYASLDAWLDMYTLNDNILASSFTEEETRQLFGWDRYVQDKEDLPAYILEQIVQKCITLGSLENDEPRVEGIYLYNSEDDYSATRNTLYVYLSRDVLDSATGETTSFYYPFVFENLRVITDESGALTFSAEDIDKHSYTMEFEDCGFYEEAGLIPLDYPTQSSGSIAD